MEDLTQGLQLELIIKIWLEARGWKVEKVYTIPGNEDQYVCYKETDLLTQERQLQTVRNALCVELQNENMKNMKSFENDLSKEEQNVLIAAGDLHDDLGDKKEVLNSDMPMCVKELWLAIDKMVQMKIKEVKTPL